MRESKERIERENEREEPAELAKALTKAVWRGLKDQSEAALMFSGGLDSSILALVSRKFAEVTLYTVGTQDSHDIKKSREAGYVLDLELKEILIDERAVEDAVRQVIELTGSENPLQISFLLPIYFVSKNAKEGIIMSGQGADELFGGYERYSRVETSRLNEVLRRDTEKLVNEEMKTEYGLAARFGKELFCPFLGSDVIDLASGIPAAHKVNGAQRKIVLRRAALEMGVPRGIAERPKKAVQYGSGISKLMKRLAKERNMKVHEYIAMTKENRSVYQYEKR